MRRQGREQSDNIEDRRGMSAKTKHKPMRCTHGTSEQRVRWFKRGMTSGKVGDCDTFKASASRAP
jgi:predicted metalloprotease